MWKERDESSTENLCDANAEKGAQERVGVDNDGWGLGGKASCAGWLRRNGSQECRFVTDLHPSLLHHHLLGTGGDILVDQCFRKISNLNYYIM